MYTGPKLTNDDLVFGYDSGYGVADNDISTIFYPGEPTTNYADDTVDAQGGWGGGYSLIDSATKKFRFNVNNFAANPGAGWRCFVWDMRAHAGSAVTISATVEVPDDSPGNFAWIMIGQSSSGSNGTSSANYHGYSATSERYQKSTKNTERITWSGTIGNTGTANQPNGYIGFTIWYNNGTPGTNSYVDISNIQIEKISHATPFVNGSRSNTASLIDLKRNIDINVSNVSFNSTGQPTFDGTNDYIYIDNSILNVLSFTIEAIVNITSSGNYNKTIFTCGNLTSTGIWFLKHRSGLGNRLVMHGYDGVNPRVDVQSTNVVPDAENTHIAVTFNGTSYQTYINGVADGNAVTDNAVAASSDNYIGRQGSTYLSGEVPVLKIYNQALSADEIKSNFNAYKNRFNI